MGVKHDETGWTERRVGLWGFAEELIFLEKFVAEEGNKE